ncbi:MAG: hypothetical protein ACLGHP_06680, partial [Vicinamibacteria bacterium]
DGEGIADAALVVVAAALESAPLLHERVQLNPVRGQVTWGRGRRDGPAGERNSPENDARPLPTRPAAALIGRIGGDEPFFIGDETGAIRVRESGRLHLGVNDDYLADNSGSFRVVVYY